MTTGIFTVIGVVVGGAIGAVSSYVVRWLEDRTAARRERRSSLADCAKRLHAIREAIRLGGTIAPVTYDKVIADELIHLGTEYDQYVRVVSDPRVRVPRDDATIVDGLRSLVILHNGDAIETVLSVADPTPTN